ncbi:hypothetical protein ABZ319_10530 [Nocardia sp. NPDC005978]|uniref:DUF7373 family lipoprotein n=1 Tax=Nocardia sp. NPDC005978 TaxID=3156725 RepID=UPI0033AD36AD
MRYNDVRRRSAGRRLRATVAAALAVSVLAVTGCGSESDAGEPVPNIDLSKLDTGSYDTKPQVLAAKDPAKMARNLEALRLGDAMPLPQDIDPALTYGSTGGGPFTGADSFDSASIFGWFDKTEFDANAAGLVAGFSTSARSNEDTDIAFGITAAVMVFDSDDAAAAAAIALGRKGFNDNSKAQPAVPQRYSSAQLTWIPDYQVLASWYATGKYVINTLVRDNVKNQLKISDQGSLVALAERAVTVLSDRLRTFEPTPPDKLASLPIDPQGLMRLTLLRPNGDKTAAAFDGTLTTHGALHRWVDDTKTAAIFDRAGADYVGYGAGELTRTRDTQSARTFITDLSANKFQQRIDPPPGLPTALCFKYRGPATNEFPYNCYVSHGRYAAQVWSYHLQDAYQRVSAQYAILANDR